MRHLLLGAAVAALLAAAVPAGAADTPAPVASAQRMGTWGFDLAGRDLAVAPGADFFTYANGTYMKALVIPADRSRYGAFDALAVLSENRVHDLLDGAAQASAPSADEARVGAFYKAFMDEGRIEALDAKPLAPDLAAIRAADTRSKLAALMGQANAGYFGTFFGTGIAADAREPLRYAVYLTQAGLGLPDRDYYLQASFAPQKAAYQAYVISMLKAIAWPDAEAQGEAVVALESAIAQASWTKVEQRDPVATYNAMTPAELAALAPGFDWTAYFGTADLGQVNRVVVGEKTAFPKIAAIYAATPIATLQAWQAFTVADGAAPYLSKRFAQAHFEFRNKTLSGQQEQKARWKRAAATVDGGVGEAVGKLYV
ncbi:MAG: M13 family metallopeptidase N-terminal domain-containing protein, partial [Caulobacteraceae bacterium]